MSEPMHTHPYDINIIWAEREGGIACYQISLQFCGYYIHTISYLLMEAVTGIDVLPTTDSFDVY